MHFIITATAVLTALSSAEPTAKPEPLSEHAHANHGLAKRWSGYGTWGCGCPLYGGYGYGTGVGYGVGLGSVVEAGVGAGIGSGIGPGIYY
ncbi:hypothetical protein GGI03_000980 [Coemansia sp. RSA 2337]|nr:hypothetical protein H4S03_003648 [Coemansia sp. S3946]KAJ2049722.1 hypothetical protein H4S04_003058 [Coemansia sp. S16]KAJ2097687.1 hypothetical protein GGI09_003698 [Coemansia sp. S100]KAJ2430742.1 hypothetical protein GGF41_000855 [Coemansia sp. RSA 2531]KAJ2468467.1 hypothetical protein GGI03_000980 [Coemansia sp. RSA 2337]